MDQSIQLIILRCYCVGSSNPSFYLEIELRGNWWTNAHEWSLQWSIKYRPCTTLSWSNPDITVYQIWRLYPFHLLRNWAKRSWWTKYFMFNKPWNIGHRPICVTAFNWSFTDLTVLQVWRLYFLLLFRNWDKRNVWTKKFCLWWSLKILSWPNMNLCIYSLSPDYKV